MLLFLPLAKEGGREIRRGYGQITQGGLSRGGEVGVLDDTIATCCVNHNALPGFHVMPKTPTDPSLARLAAKFTTFLGREHLFRRPLVPTRPANGTLDIGQKV